MDWIVHLGKVQPQYGFIFDLIEPLLKRDESIKDIKSNRNMTAAVGNSGQQ